MFEKTNIAIKLSPIHRHGVFAAKDIAPKEIIEDCPVIIFNKLKLEYRETLATRAFKWDDKSVAIALGYGSVYNHSREQANAAYCIDHQNQIIKFIANKDIPMGTEILIDYGDEWHSWFAARNTISKYLEAKQNYTRSWQLIILLVLLLILSKIFPIGSS